MSTVERVSAEIRDTAQYVYQFGRRRGSNSGETLYRFVNNLDAAVHIDLYATDDADDTYTHLEQINIGGGGSDPDNDTKKVGSSSVDSVYMTEPWARVEWRITAQSTPSSGTFKLREVTR